MSGICGFLNLALASGAATTPVMPDMPGMTGATAMRQILERMAAPLSRYDAAPLHASVSGSAAVAVAAPVGSVNLYRCDGLLVALWGRPTMSSDTSDIDPVPGGAGNHAVVARLAALWRRQGPRACAALSGPFALCLLDGLSGQALLAVDRSGSLPLHYRATAQGLRFASAADALQAFDAAPPGPAALANQALYDYLYFHMIPAPATVYRDSCRLLPGEYLHFQRGNATRGKYWSMTFDERQSTPFAPLRQRFLALLEAAVGNAVDGRPAGAFLSGGTDSSTLACMLGRVSGAQARTYSIGFDVPGYDEMAFARLASRHFGTVHHEYYVTADDVVAAVPQIAAAFDQPFGNASAVAAYYCARMARADGVTLLLGGDGGDELFGGNERYARQAVFARYDTLPSALRQRVLEPLLFGHARGLRLPLLGKARSYVEQALVTMPARLETYNLLQRYGPAAVLEPAFLAGVDQAAPLAQLHDAYWSGCGLSQINRMQALDLRYTLADNDLRKVSQACALAGIDVAFPMLDDALLAFSASLAPHHKLNGTQLRHFFKRALHGTLPRAILRKKKHGFGLPFGHWMLHHAILRQLACDSLSDLKLRRIVRASFIDELLDNRMAQHPAYHGTMVWVLMMLEQWLRQHVDRHPMTLPVQEGAHDGIASRIETRHG